MIDCLTDCFLLYRHAVPLYFPRDSSLYILISSPTWKSSYKAKASLPSRFFKSMRSTWRFPVCLVNWWMRSLPVNQIHIIRVNSKFRLDTLYNLVCSQYSVIHERAIKRLATSLPNIDRFLRAKAECFARLCHRLGVRPSVCLSVRPSVRPSVRHTRELYQNGAS